jgi:hypothetical protein
MRALALSEIAASTVHNAELTNAVRRAAAAELIKIYAPHAGKAYSTLSAQFDAVAKTLTAAASVIDPELDAGCRRRAVLQGAHRLVCCRAGEPPARRRATAPARRCGVGRVRPGFPVAPTRCLSGSQWPLRA